MRKRKEKSKFAKLYPAFCKEFPDEEHCVRMLSQQRMKKIIPCKKCKGTKFVHTNTYKQYYCENCGQEYFTFAGTYFERCTYFRARVAAIWFKQRKIRPSPLEFAQYFGMALSTAQDILNNVGFISLEKMNERETETLSSSEFLEIYCRRSLQTPAREHPRAEQKELDDHFKEIDQTTDEAFNVELDETELLVLDELSTEQGKNVDDLISKTSLEFSDILMALSQLQFKGLVDFTAEQLFKRKKKIPKPNNNEAQKKFIDKFTESIKNKCHRISRKYIQVYLADAWATEQDDIWTDEFMAELLDRKPLSRAAMRAYTSPYYLQIPFCAS